MPSNAGYVCDICKCAYVDTRFHQEDKHFCRASCLAKFQRVREEQRARERAKEEYPPFFNYDFGGLGPACM